MAEEIHARARIPGPPYDMKAVARALGFRVRMASGLGGPTGILIAGTIIVDSAIGPGAVAMTIAHELAHAANDAWRVIPDHWPPALEYQMDAVAAALLMPKADAAKALFYGVHLERLPAIFAPIPAATAAMRAMRIQGLLGLR